MADTKSISLRKRQQIASANRTMFMWAAGASVVVGFALVLSLFLIQNILFQTKVIDAKTKTASTLRKNIDAVEPLRENVRVLDTDAALKSVRLNDTDRSIQSVLDALPTHPNDTALGSSLTTRVIGAVNGVSLDTITVTPVSETATPTEGDTGDTQFNQQQFTFTVSVDAQNTTALQEVLQRLEKSIRAFNVVNVSVESQGSKRVMTVTGHAYYEPPKTIELKDKVIKQ